MAAFVMQAARNSILENPIVFSVLFIALIGLIMYVRIPRLPKAPRLQISTLPGAAGAAADIAAFVADGSKVMQIGYDRFSRKGQSFLMRTPSHTVFVAAPHFIDEIRAANDSELNPLPANNVIMQLRHTLHAHLEVDQYHFSVVQKQLTQNLGPGLPDVVDEAKHAWAEELGKPKGPVILKLNSCLVYDCKADYVPDWTEIAMWDTTFRIVTRTANRLLFGKCLASNPEFLRFSIDYSFVMFGGADLIRSYPSFLKPLVMYFRTSLYKELAVARKHLIPIIKDRIEKQDAYLSTNRADDYERVKEKDAIQWVLDISPPDQLDPELLMYRMIHITISAVHTSSVTFLDCINELAARPEIHDELREEIRSVFETEGGKWRKQGLTKLVKMDSFMRETVRFNPLFAGQLDRVALKDTTLSDGTLLPKGTYVTVPSFAMYMDDMYYKDAKNFDPFRFSKKRQESGQETLHSFVQTTPSFLHFGYVLFDALSSTDNASHIADDPSTATVDMLVQADSLPQMKSKFSLY
ncbi:hypothetical protein HBH98_219170 [Parastagonospora nodorum]|nr:hypothetical protein HBH53_213480 [Parastagonospora nodorum]KAH3958186.1 hypothetical protein HBH51_212910 [Parastagonospora nodorum]KAH4016017.1 hypothetical protein HBI09_204770 [Parastagonospora nodorum]KAH4043449.1 hypothetical protein HBH49_230530 [Parastagonospora nodorum]KAH4337635.1 hypothetical protein HBH98_219170 [Parastagonospora nodorum]